MTTGLRGVGSEGRLQASRKVEKEELSMATVQMPALKALSLTHVLYDPIHPLSLPLSLATLLPLFLFSHHFSIILITRRLTALHLLVGQLLNEIFSLFLKRHWRSDRPLRHLASTSSKLGVEYEALMSGYGMPSSHAQFMGFLVAWSFGFVWFVMGKGGLAKRSARMDNVRKVREAVFLTGILAVSGLVCYSRWHLQYHSVIQVVAGLFIGLAVGTAWITATEIIPLRQPNSVLAAIRRFEESWWRVIGGLGGFGFGGPDGGWLESSDPRNIATSDSLSAGRKQM